MDEATFRAMLLRQFDQANTEPDTSHDMYTDDAVLEFPQSGALRRRGELPGVETTIRPRSTYDIHEIRGPMTSGSWSSRSATTVVPRASASALHELRGDKIARETIYVAEGWDAPE